MLHKMDSLELPKSPALDTFLAPQQYELSANEEVLATYNKSDDESMEIKSSSHDISSIDNSNDL